MRNKSKKLLSALLALALVLGLFAGMPLVTNAADSLPYLSNGMEYFGDTDISVWAKDAVQAMQSAGIINGKPGNLFGSAGHCSTL